MDGAKRSQMQMPTVASLSVALETGVKRVRPTISQVGSSSDEKRPRIEEPTEQAIEPESEGEAGNATPAYSPSPASLLDAQEIAPSVTESAASAESVQETQLSELLELEDDGFAVVWPTGWTAASARAKMRGRPPLK